MIRKDAQLMRAQRVMEGRDNNAVIYIAGKPLVLFRKDDDAHVIRATYDGKTEIYAKDQIPSLIDFLSLEHEGHDIYLKEEPK